MGQERRRVRLQDTFQFSDEEGKERAAFLNRYVKLEVRGETHLGVEVLVNGQETQLPLSAFLDDGQSAYLPFVLGQDREGKDIVFVAERPSKSEPGVFRVVVARNTDLGMDSAWVADFTIEEVLDWTAFKDLL